jgi:hypothetical protein
MGRDKAWERKVRRAKQRTGGKCYRCGAPATGVHGLHGRHDEGALVAVCKKCHDNIHEEERKKTREYREQTKTVAKKTIKLADGRIIELSAR